MELKPKLLLEQTRNNLVELQFYGWIVFCDSRKNIKTFGGTNSYPFFHRSCAKPFQASIIKDFNTKEYYSLTDKEIAVCCASHTGEPVHLEILKGILDKIGLSEKDLLCPVIEPLNKQEQRHYEGKYSPLHNNCSGKHTLMLAVCRQMGWDIKTYIDINHPLQKEIYKQIKLLCETDSAKELPLSLDGCRAPVWATSLEELSKGFYNLFCTDDYPDIKQAFLNNPYLIGGSERPDTQIMQMGQNLIAKAGAGGLLCVANTDTNEVLVFKIIDANMKARSIIAIDIMQQLGWINTNSIAKKLLENSLNKIVTTETGENVGEYVLNAKAGLWANNLR